MTFPLYELARVKTPPRTKSTVCPLCKSVMFIDNYCGRNWTCVKCGFVGATATDEEIENEMSKFSGEKGK